MKLVSRVCAVAAATFLLPALASRGAAPDEVRFVEEPGRVRITVAGQPFATYTYRDPEIPRPYFAGLRAPDGTAVTRTYPPVPGQDPTDHATFHPGLWLAFGDLSGADSWRLKAPVRHEGFAEAPRSGRKRGAFSVRNRYLAADGKTLLCRETCRYTVLMRPSGTLLLWDSTFHAGEREVVFGDQEEMGLGFRVATPITVTRGGRIRDSDGKENEAQVRGRQAAWCDYSGEVEGRRVGITLMPDPGNSPRSWYHARDYGLLVANPFAGEALGKGPPSRVVIPPGEARRLRFGVLVHSAPRGPETDLEAAYRDYLGLLSASPAPRGLRARLAGEQGRSPYQSVLNGSFASFAGASLVWRGHCP